jgi:hypothetical protein
MKGNPTTIIGRIVVTSQAPAGIVAQINGQPQFFRNREALFRAAVNLAEQGCQAENLHPPPKKGG